MRRAGRNESLFDGTVVLLERELYWSDVKARHNFDEWGTAHIGFLAAFTRSRTVLPPAVVTWARAIATRPRQRHVTCVAVISL